MKNTLSIAGAFMLIFLLFAGLMSCFALFGAHQDKIRPNLGTILKGQWTLAYEDAYDKALPFYDAATATWGIANYALYGAGKDGVLIGDDGWLFTSEEFTQPKNADAEISAKVNYIASVQEELKQKNIKLVVALLPSKARLYREHLGSYRFPVAKDSIYVATRAQLAAKNIVTADILSAFERDKDTEALFLRTDTHWTPKGAEIAARETATMVMTNLPQLALERTNFTSAETGSEPHTGDLLRYVPLGFLSDTLGPRPDTLSLVKTYADDEKDKQSQDTLFGDVNIPVALVGTSYSANPSWNFAGALKEALQADVLNAADEGLGPFETMRNYLASPEFGNTTPHLVIWEIPERYLTMHFDKDKIEEKTP